jgi:hypothetical protein
MNKTAFVLFSTDRYNKAIAYFRRTAIALLKPNYKKGFFFIMTHPIYTESALAKLSAAELKQIALELGAAPTDDDRDFWLKSILSHQSGITKAFSEIPTALIEEKILDLLGVVIIDREDYDDFVVPHGDIRFWVHRFDDLLGTVSTWVVGGVDTYHPNDYSKPKTDSRCDSLFSAVCQLLPKQELEITYREAEFILRQRFATAPDYI